MKHKLKSKKKKEKNKKKKKKQKKNRKPKKKKKKTTTKKQTNNNNKVIRFDCSWPVLKDLDFGVDFCFINLCHVILQKTKRKFSTPAAKLISS